MESKIKIDINYSSREPQIVIQRKESEDSRDTLVAMLVGSAMPGTNDGYCRIERYTGMSDRTVVEMVVITPVHPIDMIQHIPAIAKLAEENAASDTSGVPAAYKKILREEYGRVSGMDLTGFIGSADEWAVKNLPPDLYKKWTHEVLYPKA